MANSDINQRRITYMTRFAENYSRVNSPKFILTERWPVSTQHPDIDSEIRVVGLLIDVQLHFSSNVAEMAKIMQKCLLECRNNDSEKYNHLQKCSFYLSVLLFFLPSLKSEIVEALNYAGARVEVIETQEQRARVGFVLEEGDDESSLSCVNMCYFGQAVLLLYKKIPSQTYLGFMRNRTNELRALAVVPTNQEVHIAFRQEEASLINCVMGCKENLRKAILLHILEFSQNQITAGPFAAVCKYLCKNLEWNGMESLVSIVDNLLLTKSPALHDLRIAGELWRLVEAFKKVTACSMPQYFRILAPLMETFVLWRSKFPTIIALAQSIGVRGRQCNNNNSTTTTTWSENDLVRSLRNIHEKYMLTAAASQCRGQS